MRVLDVWKPFLLAWVPTALNSRGQHEDPLSEDSILSNNWFNVWNLQKYLTWEHVSLHVCLLIIFFLNHYFSFLLPLTKHSDLLLLHVHYINILLLFF